MTTVVNKKTHRGDGVYIGRGTPWGNPYKIGVDGDRATVISRYRTWLWAMILNGNISINDLADLKGQNLICHCAPRACHGDVLKNAVEWAWKQIEWVQLELDLR